MASAGLESVAELASAPTPEQPVPAPAPAPPPASRSDSIEAQPPSGVDVELLAVPSSVLTWRAQWQFAASESHQMAFASLPRRCFGPDADVHAMAARAWDFRCLRHNPFYWVGWLGTAVLICIGRRMHACAGQHGPVSDPESHVEHEVRVWWVYPSDAAFLGGLGLAAVDLVWFAVEGTLTERYHWSKLVVCAVLYSSYIVSNFAFLHAMYQHSGLHVRAGIAGNAALALALICMLLVTLARALGGHVAASVHAHTHGHSWLYVVYTWVLRVIFVLFLVLMSATYCRLWRAYDPTSARRLREAGGSELVEVDDKGRAAATAPPRTSPQRRALLWN